MIEFCFAPFVSAREELRGVSASIGKSDDLATKDWLEQAQWAAGRMLAECERYGLTAAKRRLNECLYEIRTGKGRLTCHRLTDEIDEVDRLISDGLDSIILTALDGRKAGYHSLADACLLSGPDRIDPLSERAKRAFPSAVSDIQAACNCFAVDQNTACVFHAMRACEIGLRALARDRRIKFKRGSLDKQQWGEIIKQTDVYIGKIREEDGKNWRSEGLKEAQVDFYHRAIIEFRSVNEAWRRHTAHAHEGYFYDDLEAERVINHVCAFLDRLSVKISERGRLLPIHWRRL